MTRNGFETRNLLNSSPVLLPKGSFVKYDQFMRVSVDNNQENEKYFTLKMSIVALIRYVNKGYYGGFEWKLYFIFFVFVRRNSHKVG